MPATTPLAVRVFRNLTRSCFSIQARTPLGWRTVAHASEVLATGAGFKVHEAGRQRVLATGRKQVHAWVCGELVAWVARPGLDGGHPEASVALAPAARHELADTRVGSGVIAEAAMAASRDRPEMPWEPLAYNPRKAPTFVAGFDRLPVTAADAVWMGRTFQSSWGAI